MKKKSNNIPVYGAKVATHVPGHEAGVSDVISNLIRVYINNDLYSLYKFSADIIPDTSAIINYMNIGNVPPFPNSPAPFPAGGYEENPTSVVNKTLGNYRHIYEVVQTSGRSVNNRWFVKNQGISPSDLASIPSTTVQGHYDYILRDHTEYGKSKHVIVERFSAPGSSYTMPLGMLDVEAEEFSSYNSLNFRNLDVRKYLSKWLSEHYSFGEINNEEFENLSLNIPKTIIHNGATHKIPRNTRYMRQKDTSTLVKKNDNFWKQSQIPARGHQYHWINSSTQSTAGLQGFASIHKNVSAQYPAIDTDPSSSNYGTTTGKKPKTGNVTYSDGHSHTYIVDGNGDGTTSTNDGHYHSVVGWELSQVCDACDISDCGFTLAAPSCECVEEGTTTTPSTSTALVHVTCHIHTIQMPMEDGFPFLNTFQNIGNSTQEQIRIIDKQGTEVFFEPHSTSLEGNYILGDDILDADIWEKYEDGTTTLNELILNRSGPYPYPSWKQIRNVDNPMVSVQRKKNIISVLNSTNSDDMSAEDTATNYVEPNITWNKSMSHRVFFTNGSDAMLVHTYNNNIEVFVNDELKERVDFVKSTEQMYDLLRREHGQSIQLRNIKYSEYIFPKKTNVAFLKTRVRINHKEIAGFDSSGYDRRSTDIRTFWKDEPLDRRRTPYNAGDYTNAGKNAFNEGARNSSVWALDYHKHKAKTGESSSRHDHIHTYDLDEKGNGITSTDSGHFHIVKNWQMLDYCECDITDCNFNLSTRFCESDCAGSGTSQASFGLYNADIESYHCAISDCSFYVSTAYCESDCTDPLTSGLASFAPSIADCHSHSLDTEIIMRGDLAWAGYAQTRGFIYNSTELEAINEQNQGGPSLAETSAWASPRPALQYIHNPNTMKAKEDGWPWDAGKAANNTPWKDSYTEYSADIKPHGKDYSLLPEYRVSKHMDFYVNDNKGNFKVKVSDEDIMELQGINENMDSDTLNAYSITEDIKHIEKISSDYLPDTKIFRLEVDAIIKLLPYNGFYPSQRSVQLGGLFYDSVIPHVTGTKGNLEPELARTAQAALQPYFAPGILFNSIKSGIAVDWAAYAGKYDGGGKEISMRDKFLGRSFMSKSGMNTEAGKAVMKRAMSAWTRDVKLGKVNSSDYDDKDKGFNSYYCAALNSAGKQYNRLFKIVSQQCNTRDFISWCNTRGLDSTTTEAQNEFRQNVCGDSNWNYNPSITTELYKVNVESLLGKDIIPSSNNNPNNVKMIVSTILSELEDLPTQSPNLSTDAETVSERDLEGAYMDFVPNKRIPFEGLVSISKGLSSLNDDQAKIFYAAPSYYLERFEISSNSFEMLKHCDTEQDLYNNLRYPYFEWTGDNTALYELAMHNFLAEIPNFFMKNKKFTTFTSAGEDKFKDATVGKTYYMDISLYKQGDIDMTLSPFDGTIAKVQQSATNTDDSLLDLNKNLHTTQGRYYGPALRYKPLSASNNDNFYIGDPAQAAYTPPYFYGKAIARLSYKATTPKPSLNDILSNLSIEYINTDLDDKFAAHSPNNTYVNTPAYKGRMTLESSINIKGSTNLSDTGEISANRWTISPKFESPVLNFNTEENKEILRDSVEAGKPRGIGMWSGYGEIPKKEEGLYFELLDSFPTEEKDITADETKYIVSIGIPMDVRELHNNTIELFEPKKDIAMATDEIKFGQPQGDGDQIFPEVSINGLQSEFFGLTKGTQFYHKDSRIRTIYTSEHATKNNPKINMKEYDIEAYFESPKVKKVGDARVKFGVGGIGGEDRKITASNLVPRAFDVANAICYHINYNNQTDKDYNWRATVKWISSEHEADIIGASLNALSDKDPAYKDNNLTGLGAIVEIEWVRPEGDFTTNDKPSVQLVKSSGRRGLRCLRPSNKFYKPSFGIGFNRGLRFYPQITSNEQEKVVSNYGSLIELCGFSRNESKSRIGEIALEKEISEAVIMIPFVEAAISDSEYATTIEVEGKNFFKIDDAVYADATGESIANMKDSMKKYNLPPHYDFAKYSTISPFVMYVFEFTEKLDQDDLSNIWQGLMPNIAKRSTKFNNDLADQYSNKQVIEHKLNKDNFFEGKKLPPATNSLKWITFKVKRKANIDYYNVTSDISDDENFKFTTSAGESLKPDYSYNWPYDYFSLVELAKISGGISIVPKKAEDEEE